MSRIEQSGRMWLRRPKPPIKGGSAPEEEEEEKEEEEEEEDDDDMKYRFHQDCTKYISNLMFV